MRLAKPHKYRAKPCVIDGNRFASQAEGRRYQELQMLMRAGKISCLTLQPIYNIHTNGKVVGKYLADFRYLDHETSKVVVEDVKGYDTPLSKFKRKYLEACGIQINIVKMKSPRKKRVR